MQSEMSDLDSDNENDIYEYGGGGGGGGGGAKIISSWGNVDSTFEATMGMGMGIGEGGSYATIGTGSKVSWTGKELARLKVGKSVCMCVCMYVCMCICV